MKSICYIVPYFGKLPVNFQQWLLGCKFNKTINWVVITDDKTEFEYPDNVAVYYESFESVKTKVRSHFDFEVVIDRPWNICVFRPAFGEIFSEYLINYDFWGYCDTDLMWGDIRRFYTDEVLSKYDRVGYLGHSTLYKNEKEVNSRYRVKPPGQINYEEVYSGKVDFAFDERGMDFIYDYLQIPYFNQTVFAHLKKYESGFFLGAMPASKNQNNRFQVFEWKYGRLFRYYLKDKELVKEEFMYIHYFCRPIKFKVAKINDSTRLVMYPDTVTDKSINITLNNVKKYGQRSKISFLLESLWKNRKKITLNRILLNIENYKRDLKKKQREF